MIILEGPDGGGKTTLLETLLMKYPSIAMHERASEGVKGPVAGLYEWTHRDLHTWDMQTLSFYDRHPLVSEYIYGPIIRGTIDPRFHGTPLRRRLARRALVIVCLPPLDTVRASVSADRDMPGVTTHIDAIWTSYASLRATWPVSTGILYYDWTARRVMSDELDYIFASINCHRTEWEQFS